MTRSKLLAGAVLVLAVAACRGPAAQEVAPFDEIAVSGPDIETDPSGTAAILTVESDGSAITSFFTVTVDDGESFGPHPAGSEPVVVEFRGQVLRFDVAESSGGNTGAVEIEVFGEPAG